MIVTSSKHGSPFAQTCVEAAKADLETDRASECLRIRGLTPLALLSQIDRSQLVKVTEGDRSILYGLLSFSQMELSANKTGLPTLRKAVGAGAL